MYKPQRVGASFDDQSMAPRLDPSPWYTHASWKQNSKPLVSYSYTHQQVRVVTVQDMPEYNFYHGEDDRRVSKKQHLNEKYLA